MLSAYVKLQEASLERANAIFGRGREGRQRGNFFVVGGETEKQITEHFGNLKSWVEREKVPAILVMCQGELESKIYFDGQGREISALQVGDVTYVSLGSYREMVEKEETIKLVEEVLQ